MGKQITENHIDTLIMLLSTDWLFDHWTFIGLMAPEKEKAKIQRGCREIVQQIMKGAKEYWLVSFSSERLKQTSSRFQELLQTVKIEETVKQRINALASRKSDTRLDEGSRWLLTYLTQMLVNESAEVEAIHLEPAIKEKVVQAWTNLEVGLEQIDFRFLAATSDSTWDTYLRSLTPDLPTYICDYLMVDVIGESKFEIVWQVIHHGLNPMQRNELLNWYQAAARAVHGGDVTFPYLGDTVQ